jgi:hypothetical protein
VPLVFKANDGERVATLSISPGAAGNNTFTLAVAGDPLPEKTEAVLRVNLPTQDLGEQELRLPQMAPNQFAADGTELAVAGDWQLTAILREIGAFSWTTQSALDLGATPPAPPVVNPPPRFTDVGIAGMLLLAGACLALGFWLAARGLPRRGFALPGGCVLAVAGMALLLAGRMPAATAPEPGLALVAAPTPQAVTTPAATLRPAHEHAHNHEMAQASTPAAEALPGIGTPVSAGDLTVTLEADTRYAAPTDLTFTVQDVSGAPVTGARVTIFVEMAGIGGMHRESVQAEEQDPGRYVAATAPLIMAGPWEVAARISPKGQSSSTARFGVEVGGG